MNLVTDHDSRTKNQMELNVYSGVLEYMGGANEEANMRDTDTEEKEKLYGSE
jgi:hypothetical protein